MDSNIQNEGNEHHMNSKSLVFISVITLLVSVITLGFVFQLQKDVVSPAADASTPESDSGLVYPYEGNETNTSYPIPHDKTIVDCPDDSPLRCEGEVWCCEDKDGNEDIECGKLSDYDLEPGESWIYNCNTEENPIPVVRPSTQL